MHFRAVCKSTTFYSPFVFMLYYKMYWKKKTMIHLFYVKVIVVYYKDVEVRQYVMWYINTNFVVSLKQE